MRKKEERRFTGTVLWFNDKLGYGFIECPELKMNIFVHYSRLQNGEKWKSLSKSQFVEFETVKTEKGLMAVNVQEQKIVPAKATVIDANKANNQGDL